MRHLLTVLGLAIVLASGPSLALGQSTSLSSPAAPTSPSSPVPTNLSKGTVPGDGSPATGTSAPQGVWAKTSPLLVARSFHSATLLPSGKVLVAGGCDKYEGQRYRSCTTVTPSAELFDPAKQSWTKTGEMKLARMGHSATLLSSGKVLIAGGCTEPSAGHFSYACKTATGAAELYDPSTGRWTETAPMKTNRTAHSAALIPPDPTGRCAMNCGKVLVVGNNEAGLLNSVPELYDPASGSWSQTGALPTRIGSCCAALFPMGAGKTAMIGGSSGPDSAIFSNKEATWTPIGGQAINRTGWSAAALPAGRVLVSGGLTADSAGNADSSSEILDAATPAGGSRPWTPAGRMQVARAIHTSTPLADGKVLVTGGGLDPVWAKSALGSPSADVKDPVLIKKAELFDPGTRRWAPAGEMLEARGIVWLPNNVPIRPGNFSSTLLKDGRVLVAGGDALLSWNKSGLQELQDLRLLGSAELYAPSGFSPPKLSKRGPGTLSRTAGWKAIAPVIVVGILLVAGVVAVVRRRGRA